MPMHTQAEFVTRGANFSHSTSSRCCSASALRPPAHTGPFWLQMGGLMAILVTDGGLMAILVTDSGLIAILVTDGGLMVILVTDGWINGLNSLVLLPGGLLWMPY